MSRRPTVPTGWSYSTIGDVCTFGRGVSWKKSQERRLPTQGAVPVLRIPNVQKTLDLTRLMYIDGLSKAQQAKARVKKGWTLLVGSNGNPKRVGNCVYVDNPRDFLFASFLIGAKSADARRVDDAFLYRLLGSTPVQNDICQSLQGSTGLRNMDLRALKSLRALVPPLLEQCKIAAILSSVDNAIEKTQAFIDQVQVVKRGLMQELFVRGIPGRHTQFKQSKIGEIPTEWTVVQLEELCSHVVDCLHRTPPYTDVGYPAIRTSDLLAGRLLLDKAKKVSQNTYLEQISRLEPTAGDVLYSREGTFGLAASVPPHVRLCISQRMMHFRARPSIDSGFLMWLLNSPTVYRQAVNSVGGSTVGHVNIRSIRRFLVPLPEREEQTQLAAVLNSVSQVEVTSERALSGHQRAKRALMSVLLTGELRVTPDPEPA